MAGVLSATGYNQRPVKITKGHKSTTTYKLSLRLTTALNLLVSFSSLPLVWIFYAGCIITMVGMVYALKIAYRKIVYGIPIEGWPSLITSIWLLGGFTIFSIGTIGFYIAKIFNETKARPLAIVKGVHSKSRI